MTNLEIIKYLATNKPTRLEELLEDIYCQAWNDGANDRFGDESSIPSFKDWLYEDASKCGMYYDYELKKWSKTINPTPTITAFYDDLAVTFPTTDPDYMWNKNNDYTWSPVMEQAINEIRLLENVLEADRYSDGVYNSFRNEVCTDCRDRDKCLRSKMAIVECPKFEDYYAV